MNLSNELNIENITDNVCVACRSTMSPDNYVFPDITKVFSDDMGNYTNVFSQEHLLNTLKEDHNIDIIESNDKPYNFAVISNKNVSQEPSTVTHEVTPNPVEAELLHDNIEHLYTEHTDTEHNN